MRLNEAVSVELPFKWKKKSIVKSQRVILRHGLQIMRMILPDQVMSPSDHTFF
eukprot:m.281565 g.281565  ORF g.281565 m.281565 type:complete len:53 (+) comp16172_c1_seq2:6156-6314(+)